MSFCPETRRASGSATATTCAATPLTRSVTVKPSHDKQLRQSWDENAEAWTRAVREGRIESRRLVTDAAMVDAILKLEPKRVLDLGCGEGWLCRALHQQGVEVVGVDASAALIEAARALGGAEYRRVSYEDLIARPASLPGPFDVVACNFALLGEGLRLLLNAIASLLTPQGALVIQTLHPWVACEGAPYRSGWRSESFSSFGEGFTPMPWFYRTLGDWLATLAEAGLGLQRLDEPLHPQTQTPLSLLMVCSSRA